MKQVFNLLLSAAIVCGLLYLGYHFGRTSSPYTVDRVDTLWHYDTITVREPQYVAVRETRRDTVMLPVVHYDTDTIKVAYNEKDSVAVEIPIEQKVYRDSLYTAYVSGFRPKLDSISIYRKDATILRNVVKTKRWGHGFHAGVGYDFLHGKPAITLSYGINYNL